MGMTHDEAKRFLRSILDQVFKPAEGKLATAHPVKLELTSAEGYGLRTLDALDRLVEEGLTGSELAFWEAVFLASIPSLPSRSDAVFMADMAVRIRRVRQTSGLPEEK